MAHPFRLALAEARAELAVLRAHGASVGVDRASEILDTLSEAAEPFTKFLSEGDASLFSGHADAWLRARFVAWEARGLAERRGADRFYAECALPRRTDVAEARDAGRAAARAAMGAGERSRAA